MAYLAIICVNGGSGSYGRADDKTEAARIAARCLKADWGHLFEIEQGRNVHANVFDIGDRDTVQWDDGGLYDKDGARLALPKEMIEVAIP